MRENYEAVGFIPQTTVANRYVAENQYILQNDERGRAVGYLLYGKLAYAKPVVVSQHCIQYEKRMRGYGQLAFREFLRRCEIAQVSSIHLRVAQDLPAVEFWQSCGFVPAHVVPGGESRNRSIVVMRLALALPFIALLSNNRLQRTGGDSPTLPGLSQPEG